jgi:putative transposase
VHFFVVVTSTFRTLYVFVIMELGSRRILHHNVTAHPTAEWTLQQFREALPGDHAYRFLIHDQDKIFSKELDKEVTAMGVRCCEHRCRHRRRIRCASVSAGRYAANAWTC